MTSHSHAKSDHLQPWIVHSTCYRDAPVDGCCLTIGNFDGVHCGHAEIIRRLVTVADGLGLPAVAMTFDPHPASLVRPHAAPRPLTTISRRAELLMCLGVDVVLVQPVNQAFISLSADTFFADILRSRLHTRTIVEGSDFRFGAKRQGDIHLLESLCQHSKMALEIVPPVLVGDIPVSSSRIRELIVAGKVDVAASMSTSLCRLTGTVIEGTHRGRTIGFPTANVGAISTLIPKEGVYAALVTLEGKKDRYPAAVHIGPNISFGENTSTVEAHLIDFSGDLYGSTVHVDFVERLRDTRKFTSVDELKYQLGNDVSLSRNITAMLNASLERKP